MPIVENPDIGTIVAVPLVGGLLALLVALHQTKFVRSAQKADESTSEGKQMVKISDIVQKGAIAFLQTEYKYLSVFCLLTMVVLCVIFSVKPIPGGDSLDGVRYIGSFAAGALLSAAAGYGGMLIATDANVRTTYAAAKQGGGLNAALQIAFAGGSVMGFTVVGLGIVGLSVFFIAMSYDANAVGNFDADSMKRSFQYLTGFGFGASSIALFARVAGGIYTKAADVGADLVGKVEEDMDEDHANNPAVIADNVGDNVGDVAGMGADLFESYVGSIIAAGSLAKSGDLAEITFPFWIAGSGILAAFIGSKMVRTKENATDAELLHSLHMGVNSASVFVLIFAAVISYLLFDSERGWNYFGCVAIGLVSGVTIGFATEYFTSSSKPPVRAITASGVTGPATVIIQGFGAGMLSCLPPAVILVITIIACSTLGGTYGVAIAAVGMLSTLGVTLATDAYGPVADNAGGLAEMCNLPDEVRELTDKLDALGNTTAATGKGFAIGSAVLTALSLLASFKKDAGLSENADEALNVVTDVADPIVLGGIIFGAVLPFLFAALTMLSVRKAATSIILEVRRQFQLNPNLKDPNFQWKEEGVDGPDYKRCIEISTKSSVDEMYLPGGLAILTPLCIGFLVGPKCLSGVLAGAIASGFMMAVMMSNAGGAWDNAKKYIEMDKDVQEKYGGKESQKCKEVKNACVVGDTVGDPFKDTSGPALNILIKLMSMVSLVFAPMMEKEDWALWYIGLIILVVEIVLAIVVYNMFWKGFEARTEAAQAGFDKAAAEAAAAAAPAVEMAKTEEAEEAKESDALVGGDANL